MKNLVREHINEKFTRESDPIHDLNIGITSNIDVQKRFFYDTIRKIDKDLDKIFVETDVENTNRFYHIPCFSFRCSGMADVVLVVSEKVFIKVRDFWATNNTFSFYNVQYTGPMWILMIITKKMSVITFDISNTDKMIKYIKQYYYK